MSNSLDPDQARRSVGPVVGLNCLQRLSADNDQQGMSEFIFVEYTVNSE